MKLAFILGQNATLSVAEIFRKLEAENQPYSIISVARSALVINADFYLENPQKFLDSLGGTIKLAEVLEELGRDFPFDEKHLSQALAKHFPKPPFSGKLLFGISAYNFTPFHSAKDVRATLNRFAAEKKKFYKESHLPCRFVPVREGTALSSVQVSKNKLIESGFELILIRDVDEGRIFVAKTLAVQDFESYNLRDFGRPFPDPRAGMLPPKLAQIMVNLSGLAPTICNKRLAPCLLYDPLCGSGTILAEALLLGFDILGSDLSAEAISRTRGNLKWLISQFGLPALKVDSVIFQSDIKELHKTIKPASIDAVVTEPYLGPPLRALPTKNEVGKIFMELSLLYAWMLQSIHRILKPQGTCVAVFPKIAGLRLFLKMLDDIKNLGYAILRPISKEQAEAFEEIFSELSPEGTIFYARPDAKLIREIVILKKR